MNNAGIFNKGQVAIKDVKVTSKSSGFCINSVKIYSAMRCTHQLKRLRYIIVFIYFENLEWYNNNEDYGNRRHV